MYHIYIIKQKHNPTHMWIISKIEKKIINQQRNLIFQLHSYNLIYEINFPR